MGLFERFPYTNFHDLNLTWILNELKTLEHTINEFVSINALKYADPIQWNITAQYEKNTIVIDPLTGTAYISVQPVPSGVALTNTDYWTVVFDLGSFVVRAAKNFTSRYEDETTLTATFPSSINDWLIWGDTLYRAISNIVAGDQYVVGSNIIHFTAEDVIGHIQDLNTTDKSNLVAAINEVLHTLADTCGDLDDLNTTDKSNLVAAINEVLQTFADEVGDLNDLPTSDKTSIVNSILEFYTTFTNLGLKSVKDYGAVGDGVTDDTQAFQDAVNDLPYGSILLIPTGTYYLSDVVNIGVGKRITFIGESGKAGGSTILYTTNGAFNISNEGSSFYNVIFRANGDTFTTGAAVTYNSCYRITLEDCDFIKGYCGVQCHGVSELHINRCTFIDFTDYNIAYSRCINLDDTNYNAPIDITNCLFRGTNARVPQYAIKAGYCDGLIIDNCTINNFVFGIVLECTNHIQYYTFITNCILDTFVNNAIACISNAAIAEVARIRIRGTWIGVSHNAGVLLLTNTSGDVHDVEICDCIFALNEYDINADGTNGYVGTLNIHDNSFSDATTQSLRIESVNFAEIHNNVFNVIPVMFGSNATTIATVKNNVLRNVTSIGTIGSNTKYGSQFGGDGLAYTPTITAESGTLTSYTAEGHYVINDNIMHVECKVSITDAGSGTGQLQISLPVSAKNITCGNATVQNRAAYTYIPAAASAYINESNGSSAIATGNVIVFSADVLI